MRRIVLLFIIGISPFILACGHGSGEIVVLKIEAPIFYGTSDLIVRTLGQGYAEGYIIVINTNGGLLKATEEIVDAISSCPAKVVVFIPPGGRAFSAGAYIAMAADIVAAANGSAIGACSPVPYSEKEAKAMASWIQSLAEANGRPGEIARKMVTENLVLTAAEAYESGIADIVCSNISDLLIKMGWSNVSVVNVELDLKAEFLNMISDPVMAWFLFTSGILLLMIGLKTPTLIGEGIGVTFIILALYGMGLIQAGWSSTIIMILGIAIMFLEIKAGHGVFAIGGVILSLIGLFLIYQGSPLLSPGKKFAASIFTGLAMGGILSFYLYKVKQVLKRKEKFIDPRKMLGEKGIVKTEIRPGKPGVVLVGSELWTAISSEPIKEGMEVKVVGVEGLTLKVERSL